MTKSPQDGQPVTTLTPTAAESAAARSAPAPAPERPTPQPTRPREVGGRDGPEPTRFGDWEKAGRCIDF